MPTMRKTIKGKVIAILLADIHLSLRPPIWRSAEPAWLEAQYRPLEEVKLLQDKYDCPIICAGDIFDRWNCSPELINWALKYLPDMYTIPGQHDLPFHNYDDLHRSAFWTLVEANKITNLLPDIETKIDSIPYRICDNLTLRIYAYPFGYDIHHPESQRFNIAIIHKYVWIPGHSYSKAVEEDKIQGKTFIKHKWMGYDVVVYGDNHNGFQTYLGTTTIFNCGTLIRRASDEIDYKPQVGLLLSSGKVVPHYLDISKDKYLGTCDDSMIKGELDMSSFIQELEKLGDTDLNFVDAMKQLLRKKRTSPKVKEVILKAMEVK